MDTKSHLPDLALFAVVVGVVVFVVCLVWGQSNDLTEYEAAKASADAATTQLKDTIADMGAGKSLQPLRDTTVPTDQPDPWPADHPIWSGLIAAGIVLVIGRVLVFMERMERRP